ncbi:MAG: PTS sugar transporter subunit IIA [Spirochaetaceae bacterium]|nr:PTS sugar transporter subunit IIA [Spirochaetaceae bacterium]
MDLARVFAPEVILVPLRAHRDDDALRQLVETLVASAGLSDPDRIMHHLTEEASLRATLVGHGAGIVHTRLDELAAPVAALGILAPGKSLHLGAGLQFIVDVIFLVLSPVSPPEPHLELVASIAALVRDPVQLNRLRAAADARDALAVLAAFQK